MALTPEQMKKLPPSVAALLASQGQGDQQLPAQKNQSQAVLGNLTGALGRRFGEQKEFDADYDREMRGMIGQVPQLSSQYETRRGRMGEDFTLTAEQLDKQNEDNRRKHLISMADRGIGYSGANLVGQGKIGEQFQKGVQGANTAYTRGLSDLSTDEAGAYQRIQARAGEVEGQAAGRATARDEKRKWEEEQRRVEADRMKREQQQQEMMLQQQQQEQANFEAQLRQMEAQSLASAQPMPGPTGSMSYGGGGGGGGRGGGPALNTNTNVSVDTREFNLRDPNEVAALQRYLGLPADGKYGPTTDAALNQRNAVRFDDRPIDPRSRNQTQRRAMQKGW